MLESNFTENDLSLFKNIHAITSINRELHDSFDDTDNSKSAPDAKRLKDEGNQHYGRKEFKLAQKAYTNALAKAEFNSEMYGIALANRSAVFFETKYYEECINDIKQCFRSAYPIRLRAKLYTRYGKVCALCGSDESKIKSFLTSPEVALDKHKDFLEGLKETVEQKFNVDDHNNPAYVAAEVSRSLAELQRCHPENSNELLPGGTSALKLCKGSENGRHIRADRNIDRGEILFLEKAFVFAQVFEAQDLIKPEVCYNCLVYSRHTLPCTQCSLCFYCCSECRDDNWHDVHRWECKGMESGLWYRIGIALPGFKALVKCIAELESANAFRNLVTHCDQIEQAKKSELFHAASVTIFYLFTKTDFFEWAYDRLHPDCDAEAFVAHVGVTLAYHMSRLACNSSVVFHYGPPSTAIDDLAQQPNTKSDMIACAIYPSVSLMNHSCKSNVSVNFLNDYIVVRAKELIKNDEQVFNSYGIDYSTEKSTRLALLKDRYYFTCKCAICKDDKKDYEWLDAIMCHSCFVRNVHTANEPRQRCAQCHKSLPSFDTILSELSQETDGKSRIIQQLAPSHEILLQHWMERFKNALKKGNFAISIDYFHNYLNCLKIRVGNSQPVAADAFCFTWIVIESLQSNSPVNKSLYDKVVELFQETDSLLRLHYAYKLTVHKNLQNMFETLSFQT